MKKLLCGLEMFLILGLAMAADGIEARYGLQVWAAVGFGTVGLAVLLGLIADRVPDRPRRKRRGRARARRPGGENDARKERVRTLRPTDEEERVWY